MLKIKLLIVLVIIIVGLLGVVGYLMDQNVKLKGDKWIVYPWVREDSETIQDYLNRV